MKRFLLFGLAAVFVMGAGAAQADMTLFDAKRLVDNTCYELRSKANFTISPKCSFRVTDMVTHDSTDGPAADITVFSSGFLYDIHFVARYRLSPTGDHQLVDVYKIN